MYEEFDYIAEGQLSLFDINTAAYKINKPIRLIELFAGIGSQAMALRNIGADFEHYRVVEWDKYAIKSYNSIHGKDFECTDITKLHGEDLGIEHMDELITRFKSGELDIRDIIEQSYFGGRADAIDEYFAKFDNWIKSDSKLSYFWTEFQVEARRIAEQLKSQDSME